MNRTGMTLLELLVVLAVLAVTASVAAFSIRRGPRPEVVSEELAVARLRLAAIQSGERKQAMVMTGGSLDRVLVLPDGRTLSANLDPFSGKSPRAVR